MISKDLGYAWSFVIHLIIKIDKASVDFINYDSIIFGMNQQKKEL